MLFKATLLVVLFGMAATLWMAFYLFARGFPSRITLRAVIVLLALSIFFFSAYNNLFHQITGSAALRSVMLIIGMGAWYSLTYQLSTRRKSRQPYWPGIGLYVLGAITIFLLVLTPPYIDEQGNSLYVARMEIGLPYILFSIFQFVSFIGIFYNLLKDNKIGLTPQGRLFLVASIFPAIGVGYGVLGLAITDPLPRLYQDLLVFSGVFLIGLSVIRYQALVERRTMMQDFPLTSLTVLLLASAYALWSLRLGIGLELVAGVVAFALITHAIYDLAREYLERLRFHKESIFRKQLHQLECDSPTEDVLRIHLQEGLDLLCRTLNTSGGLVAIRHGNEFLVTATRHSLPVGSRISATLVCCDDVCQSKNIPSLAWIAPSFEGQTQIAVIGIGKPKTRLEYSSGDLDLLSEVADQVGTVVSLSSVRPDQRDKIMQLVAESHANVTEMISMANGMIGKIETNPDPDFVKIVEEGLRNLPDYITLGQSALADRLAIKGESHIERGKQLHRLLIESIESLKPAEKRPAEPLPRVWYNHAVLFDAYVEGVPNREVMSRLYISEGTFNRTRRNALRGLARLLVEERKAAKNGINRVLATVLFTDIVDSTKRVAEIGDRRWRDLIGNHQTMLSKEIGRFRGRFVESTSDGCLATFDEPSHAIQCALALSDESRQMGFEIRVGLHTGEVELMEQRIGGIAVHVAARVLEQARGNEVWLSRTVKDLVVGSGFKFSEQGDFSLKGIPGELSLFTVQR